jgi:hypothetical protein
MDNNFFAYLERLELLVFFSGYPLLYAVTLFIAGDQQSKNNLKSRIVSLLPFVYALVGILYLGLQLKKLSPDYSIENINQVISNPYLTIWALLSTIFWIPILRRKPVLSLLHSLVFFFFFVRDLVIHSFQSSVDKTVLRNDMKIYTDSLLLNLGALILVTFISYLIDYFKSQKRSTPFL